MPQKASTVYKREAFDRAGLPGSFSPFRVNCELLLSNEVLNILLALSKASELHCHCKKLCL